jgi:hypothetical protein
MSLRSMPSVSCAQHQASGAQDLFGFVFRCPPSAWCPSSIRRGSSGLAGSQSSAFAMAACHRRDGCHRICATTQHETTLARSADGGSADRGRCRRARQQECTCCLGHDGARRALQASELAPNGVLSTAVCNMELCTRPFRGSEEPAWVRTHDRTRPNVASTSKKALANRAPLAVIGLGVRGRSLIGACDLDGATTD